MFLGRREPTERSLHASSSAAREPQYVFGAATYGLRRHTEIKSEHATVC